MDVRNELRDLGFAHAGAIRPINSGRACKVDLSLELQGFVVFAFIVEDQTAMFLSSGRENSTFKKRVQGAASALNGVLARGDAESLTEPFQRWAPAVIAANQPIEVWVRASTANSVDAEKMALIGRFGQQWPGQTTTHRPSRVEPSFSHSELFPLIARLIVRLPGDASGFVGHDAIVAAVLADSEGAGIVARARATTAWPDDHAAASNMVAWFSQQITVGRSAWSEFFDREQQGGTWAYRPKTAVHPPIAPDIELSAIEGNPRLFFHIRRERDPTLARAKRDAMRRPDGQLACEACGFVVPSVYPGLSGDVCEVHHRRPLAEAAEAIATRLQDLAVLCPNCHRAIHRTDPLMSIEDFRARFFSSRAG